ncbi:GAF and ANTAR domain-containing protein [Rhodococcus sp. KBS0724]|jgi:GAF domain-containing protein|uniref:GAF and ANTAR domain-containing protein n=1 Tax=Rhodococcus sp. KBS0724 TaxID=1179674 RepID=UPI00110DA854|nr:GAF and ANTAR domain-containing protein [Rhodococcus sp. KBS0724]TSD48944.1 GAF and ANTAR domain-containing protein [Rhodococcus sp. KBS0724]
MVISRGHRPSPDNSDSFRRAHLADPIAMEKLRRLLDVSATSPDHVIELMTRCTGAAVELVSGVDHAGVTATLDNTPFTVAPTDPLVEAFDRAQYDFGDGPCLSASRSGNYVRMSVADVEERWPVLGDSARAAQLTDFLAVPLFAEESPVGSFNLYSQKSIDSSVRDRDVLTVLADYLGHALEAAARDDKRGRAAGALRDAIGARVDIERAVGVVMNQNDCDASVAFRELETRSAANSDNILDVARQILASIDDGPA